MENNSFTVLPMSQRFNLEPGKTYEGTIKIVNPADATGDFSYKASVVPYGVKDEEYTADLASETNRTMIADWLTIEEPTGKIAPNETKELKFTIKVPENAPSGGQYAAITVSSASNGETSGNGLAVQNIFEMASVIYANVSGETTHSGEILENNVPGFITTTPVTLSALISNSGNVHEDATFLITASDFFTGRVILPTEENEGKYNELIMPETTRKIERNVNDLPALGVVKVNQTIYYNGETSTVEKNIIICPVWFIVLMCLTITAIIATVITIIKKHHNK